jgi:amino acid transporter
MSGSGVRSVVTKESCDIAELNRTIGPFRLMLYGVGSMLGAGIYGLVGKAAGVMGAALWMGFLAAMIAALLTGISYASIASRYPRAGGAAYVTQRAFAHPRLSYVVGLVVICSGLLSIATQSKVVAANLNVLLGAATGVSIAGVPAAELALATGFVLLVAGIVYRGISESLWANVVCTFLEAGGLLLVIVVGARFWGGTDLLELPGAALEDWGAVAPLLLQGAVLTFFSFIGFEDMLNVSEEVKAPNRTMPIALIGAMLIASAIYLAVAVTAVTVAPWQELATAPGPLRLVIERSAPWFPPVGFTIITIAAVANTALVNYVMASRLIYGMARQDLLPSVLSRVNQRRQTPHVAIGLLLAIILALQFAGDISQLASATVLLLLMVFVVVNGALIALNRREGSISGCFNAPTIVPAAGMLVCLALISGQFAQSDWRPAAVAVALVGAILLLYQLTERRRKHVSAKR